MAESTFNLTAEALRKILIVAVDVSEDETTPEWEIQGYKTEDTAIEFNPDTSTITDVLGDTYTDVNKFERAINFDPNTLRPIENGGKLNLLLHKYQRNEELSKLSQFKVLIGYGYWGTPGAYEADVYPASTITPASLGGSSRVDFPFDINFGGEKKIGTIDKLKKGLKFTETV